MTKNGVVVLAAMVAIGAASCSRPSEAYVDCRNAGEKLGAGMTCSIEHRRGNTPLHVCWTMNVTCANGTKGSADGCGDVDPKGKSVTMLPYASFKGALDKCDASTAASVTNLKVTAR